jgi:dinuclear metal center YbgI/SA1388 family protein
MDAKGIAEKLDMLFNKETALEWDNCGLLVDSGNKDVKNIVLCIDIFDSVIKDAVSRKSDMIIAHHPIIFRPLKRIIEADPVGAKMIQAIKNGISIYCAHTNYDIMPGGLGDYIVKRLGMHSSIPLELQGREWFKFVVFVPQSYQKEVRDAICRNNAGIIGNYSCCTFSVAGKGTFMPLEGSNPFIGEKEKLSIVDEVRIESIVGARDIDRLIEAVVEAHPYEEVAYDVYRLESPHQGSGLGRVGDLKSLMSFEELGETIKKVFGIKNFRYVCKEEKTKDIKIKRIALINGSSNSLIDCIRESDADTVLVGEMGHHNATDLAQQGKLVIEIGHFESEMLAIDDMYDKIKDMLEGIGLNNINLSKFDSNLMSWRYYLE